MLRKTQELGPRNGEGVSAVQMPGAVDTCERMPQDEVEPHKPNIICPYEMYRIH
jgi:hypothetical protein